MKTLFYFVLVLGFVGIVPAQERVLDKAEFDTTVTEGHNHRLKWKGEKYRVTVATSSKVAGRPQTDYSMKAITEFGSLAESRVIHSSVLGDKAYPRTESLRIGNSLYTRSGNDAWTRKEDVPSSAAPKEKEESSQKILSSQAEYKYLGRSMLGDRLAHIYVKTERQTSFNEKNGESAQTESKNTYWVDAKGTILKNEYTSEHRGKDIMHTTVTVEWELDPSIAFTVPEITP